LRLLDPLGWPQAHDPADPWDGASTLPDPDASYKDHVTWSDPPLPDRETWAAQDALWQRLTWEVLRGQRSWRDPAWLACSQGLGLVGPRTHDRRPLPVAPVAPSADFQVDMVENHGPDLPEAGCDFVLGPYGDLAPGVALRQLAAAVMLFTRVHSEGRRTVDAWVRDSGRPHLDLRRALKALGRAPPMLWDPHRTPWRPLLPVMAGALPPGEVEGPITPLVPGAIAAVVARVVPMADGRWVAHTALGLPSTPPAEPLVRRLTLCLWRTRRANRRATWEDALRARPEVLYRTCATWCAEALEDC